LVFVFVVCCIWSLLYFGLCCILVFVVFCIFHFSIFPFFQCLINISLAGMLTRSQLEHVWRHYPHSHYEKMLALMEQFHVLLRMPGSSTYHHSFFSCCICPNSVLLSKIRYLIPTCLPEERPITTRENWPPWEDNANQSVRIFEFQFLPHGFLGRLMVRVLATFVPVCYWKSGLLVKGLRNGKDQDAKALIEYNPSMFLLYFILFCCLSIQLLFVLTCFI
jgi:C-terminal of Roc, COR, domain